jgi:hypothetical protein
MGKIYLVTLFFLAGLSLSAFVRMPAFRATYKHINRGIFAKTLSNDLSAVVRKGILVVP